MTVDRRPPVVCEHVSFGYQRAAPILHHIDLSIAPGEVIGLMGPSGSGKSTLLALLGGLLRPIEGRVLWNGSPEPSEIRFGWIQQTVNVFGRRTAVDNVAMALFSDGLALPDARPAALEALAAVGLRDLAGRSVSSLSGGEVQRVVIARALLAAPDLILADEPTGQLDRATTTAVVGALVDPVRGQSFRTSTSVVIATHDPVVAEFCDRVLTIVDGRIGEP